MAGRMTLDEAMWTNGVERQGGPADRLLYRVVDVDLGQIELGDEVSLQLAGEIGRRLTKMDYSADQQKWVDELRKLVGDILVRQGPLRVCYHCRENSFLKFK